MKYLKTLVNLVIYAAGIFGVGYILFAFGYGIWKEQELNKHGRYTIGTTEKKRNTVKSGVLIYYDYQVNGKNYEGSADEKDNVIVPGGRYYTKFSMNYPSASTIYFDQQVPDTIQNPPSGGWDKLPNI